MTFLLQRCAGRLTDRQRRQFCLAIILRGEGILTKRVDGEILIAMFQDRHRRSRAPGTKRGSENLRLQNEPAL